MAVAAAFALLAAAGFVAAEPAAMSSNQVGLSLGRATPLFRHPPGTPAVTYKRAIGEVIAARLGIDGVYSSDRNAERKLDLALGAELRHPLNDWLFVYTGADLGWAPTRYNNRRARVDAYGLSPLCGAGAFVHDHVSVSSEVKVAVRYVVTRDPESFDRSVNTDTTTVAVASLGAVYLNIHF